MMRVNGLPIRARVLLIAGAAIGVVIACQQVLPVTTFDAVPAGGRDTRAEFMTEVTTNYVFGPERAPVLIDTSIIRGPGGALPTITIATANRISESGRVPMSRFVYRLTSSAPYPIMGLAPGANYVWRDTAAVVYGGPYRTLVIPGNSSYPMVWLRVDAAGVMYALGVPLEPRLVKSALGYGACDNGCPPNHCPARDSTRTFTIADSLTVHIRL